MSSNTIYRTVYAGFQGADFSSDPSLCAAERSPLCRNMISDGSGLPEKRPGWRTLRSFSGRIRGLHAGRFAGENHLLVHAGTELWLDHGDAEPELLRSDLPAHRSRSVFLRDRLWIVTGGGYFVYDGEKAVPVRECEDVYVPTTVITRLPAGGGVTYESVNLLTAKRRNAFQTDGETKTFTLDGSIDRADTVRCWVWDEEVTDFTVDCDAGAVTLAEAPAAPLAGSADGLVIEFEHAVDGYVNRIDRCTMITLFGLGAPDRVILGGNPDFPCADWTSGLADPTYLPDLGYAEAGSGASAVVGYCRVGSELALVKESDGPDAGVYLRSAALSDEGEAVFSLRPSACGVGAVAPGSFASLPDDPLFLTSTGVRALVSNSLTSEKTAVRRSDFLDGLLLREEDLSEAEAGVFDGLYVLSFPNGHAYVLDGNQSRSRRSTAENDWCYEGFYWENVPAVCWLTVRSDGRDIPYFGTADGQLCRMNTDRRSTDRFSDDGAAIDALWATRYDDDGCPALEKDLLRRGCCVSLKPCARSSAEITYRTDKTDGAERTIVSRAVPAFDFTAGVDFESVGFEASAAGRSFDIPDLEDVDFERVVFSGDDGPQDVFLRRRVRHYRRLQILVRNREEDEGFGVFKITKHYVKGKYGK